MGFFYNISFGLLGRRGKQSASNALSLRSCCENLKDNTEKKTDDGNKIKFQREATTVGIVV